jgi:hypothetical protein
VRSQQTNKEGRKRYRKDRLNEVGIGDPCGENSLCGVGCSAVAGQRRVIEDRVQKVGAVVGKRVCFDVRVDGLMGRRVFETRSE